MATDINKLLAELQAASTSSSGSLDDLIDELGKQLMQMQTQAGAARQEFQQALRAPTPQVSPVGEAIVRSMGLAAESLTGRRGAAEEAGQLVAAQQGMLNQHRAESLKELEDAYRQAAHRAERTGDLETSLKLKVKADKALKDQEALSRTRDVLLSGQLAAERTQADIASRERIAELEAATRLQVAQLGVTTDRQHLPPELQAALAPTLERMKQLDQARGAIAADPKLKEGDRRKRAAEIDAERVALEADYLDKLRSYFQQPAGDSGEAAQTPLGVIMDRAKKAGAVTYEDFRRLAYSNTASALLRGYDLKKSLHAAKVVFPTEAAINKAAREYKSLTTGPLRGSKIMQNRRRIDELAAHLASWGYSVATSDELIGPPPEITDTGIGVTAPRR